MIPVCIDLETRPAFMTPEAMQAAALASKSNPKRKGYTRAEWAADPVNQIAVWGKGALGICTARICAVAIRVGDSTHARASWTNERELVDWIAEMLPPDPLWIGHNLAGFDLPILRMAAMRYSHSWLRDRIPTYRYSKSIADTMQIAAGTSSRFAGITAHGLAQSLGLPGKGDLAVIDFPALWARAIAGEVASVETVLQNRAVVDVLTEWAIWQRMTQ